MFRIGCVRVVGGSRTAPTRAVGLTGIGRMFRIWGTRPGVRWVGAYWVMWTFIAPVDLL